MEFSCSAAFARPEGRLVGGGGGERADVIRRLCGGIELDRSRPDNVSIVLRATWDFLDESSVSEAVEFWTKSDTGWMEGRVGDVDHIGFIGPVGTDVSAMTKAVIEAGFTLEQRAFPSVIVARELGVLRRVPLVPTTILMAYGTTRAGRKVGVELFLPAEDPNIVRSWIASGVATHLSVTMNSPDAYRDAMVALEAESFRVPAFKRDEPLTILPQPDGQTFLSVYLERQRENAKSRIELCSLVRAVTPSLFPTEDEGDEDA